MENEEPETPAENIEPQNDTPPAISGHKRHAHRFKAWYGTHKKWSIPLTILAVLLILAAIPWTRYNIAGLFLKKDFAVQITDATAHIPVSGATVQADGVTAETNAYGWAVLHIKVGPQTFNINKKYYSQRYVPLTVPIFKSSTPPITLVATGRQAKIHVTNLITKKTLAGVDIQVAGSSAKTDSSGNALVVLPAAGGPQKAKLSLAGYNDASFDVQVSDSSVKENDFSLTPAGEVYFVSNRSGKIDVLKANLDGSNVQTAVAGTGTEDQYGTQIMESADGKFVALVAKRSASDPTPQLYVLSTNDDKLLQADTGNAAFQLYDWVGDTLIYTIQRQDLPVWQQGASKLKAYNAESGNITLLDQSAGADSSANGNEDYTEVMVTADSVVFAKVWQGTGPFTGKQNSLQSIGIDGKNHQTIASYDLTDYLYFTQHGPNTLYIWQQNTQTNEDTYSEYQEGSAIKPLDITNDQFYNGQGTYYFSASRKQAFWAEPRDGKNSLLVGNPDGSSPVTIATASDYQPYGWFTDQYVLVSNKESNALYVMSAKGGTPIKISDYLSTGNYGY